ncbi:MAG: flavodoxin domain-containing protein [Colwellia sp.]|nr:flavodoxin domain-containing protein [Colwellia sp.]
MSAFQIIVGSMLGGTEYVAEACEEQLNTLDHQVNLHLKPHFTSILNDTFAQNTNKKPVWLICTSTHGAGDFPDNIQAFVSDLKNCEQDLSSISFMIIAIGDSSYDTFCKAGVELNKVLKTKGCLELIEIKMLDMSEDIDPEALAQEWLKQKKDLL